jgi:hypothetical protein
MEKQRGQGGKPERQGGKAKCECPKCGHVMDHTQRGTPCNKIKCPKCGSMMGPPGGKHGFGKVKKGFWDGVL